ncbi:MAG TPA: porin family protein [Robiginitalea sp.]|nr:porin family protein [Robiginitalea sp.]
MKKTLLLVMALLASQMYAQDKAFTFGVKAGANFSNLEVDTDFGDFSPDGATSIFIGAFVDLGIAESLHFQPELQYSIEGAEDADITYLNVPLMLKYYIVDGLNVQAGPQIGILLDAEGGTEGLKSSNFVLNLGAAYEFPMGVFIDARYNLGLSNIAEDDPEFDASLKTKGFQLGVGYRF